MKLEDVIFVMTDHEAVVPNQPICVPYMLASLTRENDCKSVHAALVALWRYHLLTDECRSRRLSGRSYSLSPALLQNIVTLANVGCTTPETDYAINVKKINAVKFNLQAMPRGQMAQHQLIAVGSHLYKDGLLVNALSSIHDSSGYTVASLHALQDFGVEF